MDFAVAHELTYSLMAIAKCAALQRLVDRGQYYQSAGTHHVDEFVQKDAGVPDMFDYPHNEYDVELVVGFRQRINPHNNGSQRLCLFL